MRICNFDFERMVLCEGCAFVPRYSFCTNATVCDCTNVQLDSSVSVALTVGQKLYSLSARSNSIKGVSAVARSILAEL